jgi:hypothetical protein
MHLQSALPIVRALADGVNPTTGEPFTDDSPYVDPSTLRALFSAVELMEKETEREKRRERLPANFGQPWSEHEDHALLAGFDAGVILAELARKHERTHSSIRLRLEKLGRLQPQPQNGERPAR